MNIGFVIPLKAKSVSNNWDTVCANLKHTIDSVLSQTSARYQCIVVGHDRPEFTYSPEYTKGNFRFHQIITPKPPVANGTTMDNQLAYEADRCTKILKGILELNENHPKIDYWFPLDADDLVREDFVEYLQRYEGTDAIILEKGYFYFKDKNIFNHTDEFSAYCGSSALLSNSLLNLANITSYTDFRSIFYGDISHVHMRKFLEKNGYTIAIPEARLNVYVRENGENISHNVFSNKVQQIKQSIKTYIFSINISPAERRRFGLERPK